jgi:hypothetical protein
MNAGCETVKARAIALLIIVSGMLCIHAGKGRAEAYDPTTDPNRIAGTTGRMVDWQAMARLSEEFQRPAPAAIDASPAPSRQAALQGNPVALESRLATAQPMVDPYVYAIPYGYGSAGSGPWSRHMASPRIPWWSLISRHEWRAIMRERRGRRD